MLHGSNISRYNKEISRVMVLPSYSHCVILIYEHLSFQVGMSYTCWCNIVNPFEARWDEPNTFDGLMMLIFGGVATVLSLVSIFFGYRIGQKDIVKSGK